MIVAEQVTKEFNGVEAVRSISFEVKEGETLVFLGTSGCGKTTTLKMLNRLIEATSGQISIRGKNIFEQKPELLRRQIGYVSQNDGLFPHFKVSENIGIVPKLLKWDKSDILRKTELLLERLHLSPQIYLDKYPSELSGGQKQRVALARALIFDPPVILLDEPFGALDPVTRAEIRKEFGLLPELRGKTIVMVTHDVQEATELGDRIALMEKGRIVQCGTAADLLFNPGNDFVRSFFDHQRLYLELSALKVKDIWQGLPVSASPPDIILSGKENLWTIFEDLIRKKSTGLTLSVGNESRGIDQRTLQQLLADKQP